MDEAVDDSDRHSLIREDLAPLAKGLVGSDEEGSPLVPGADEFKEHAGFGLVFGDVGEVIQDQQMEFVELGNGGFESESAVVRNPDLKFPTSSDTFPHVVGLVLPCRSTRQNEANYSIGPPRTTSSLSKTRCDPSRPPSAV